MKPEWFMFIGIVLSFCVALLWSIAADIRGIREHLKSKEQDEQR